MTTALEPISRQIWDMKYRFKSADGAPVDKTLEETWRRVAEALAAVERTPADWEGAFYEALEGFRFLPAGRILAGAGTGRDVTLFNCFVMGAVPDDMSGIFEHLKEAALTMQQGGGSATTSPRCGPGARRSEGSAPTRRAPSRSWTSGTRCAAPS